MMSTKRKLTLVWTEYSWPEYSRWSLILVASPQFATVNDFIATSTQFVNSMPALLLSLHIITDVDCIIVS